MTRVVVADEDELKPGDRKIVETESGSIGVFNVDGEYYAMRNRCPHRGGPVCTGKMQTELVGKWEGIGKRTERQFGEDPAITCPWHGWDFNIKDGKHVGLDSIKVPTYDTIIKNGSIIVDM